MDELSANLSVLHRFSGRLLKFHQILPKRPAKLLRSVGSRVGSFSFIDNPVDEDAEKSNKHPIVEIIRSPLREMRHRSTTDVGGGNNRNIPTEILSPPRFQEVGRKRLAGGFDLESSMRRKSFDINESKDNHTDGSTYEAVGTVLSPNRSVKLLFC